MSGLRWCQYVLTPGGGEVAIVQWRSGDGGHFDTWGGGRDQVSLDEGTRF